MIIEYSEYQKNIFNFIENGDGHGVVEALAGSGKTFTSIKALDYIPKGKKVLYLAFNYHIAQELKSKVPKGIRVSTVHALGKQILLMHKCGDEVVKTKIHDIAKEEIVMKMEMPIKQFKNIIPSIKQIISLLKNNNMQATATNIDTLVEYYSIDIPQIICSENFDNDEELIDFANEFAMDKKTYYKIIKKIFVRSLNDKINIDFDDMIFLPVFNEFEGYKYDYVFVDEAQDLNKTQVELIMSSVKDDGRIIAIGDSRQSIYSFRGADSNSIKNIKERLNATTLPLSITYRCPTSHVEYVKKYVKEIEAAPNAKKGSISIIDDVQMVDEIEQGDLVLCRNNSPLIRPCLKLISAGKKATIKGLDFGKQLISMIDSFNVKTIPKMLDKLNTWYERELQKAKDYNLNPQQIEDKYECIKQLVEISEASNVSELKKYVKNIFSDDVTEISLSTIHKAKGLEAENVYIYCPFLMPSMYAKKEWEIEQEENIQYVAYTRSLNRLIKVYPKKEAKV